MQTDNKSIEHFFKTEAAGGIILVFAAVLAIIMANSPIANFYNSFLQAKIALWVGPASFSNSIHHLINDGLMAIFFFLIGLEIKREVIAGELSSRERALLPLLAAVGGMLVPAIIFMGINANAPQNHAGWAIPSATDIAFALGILALLGNRVPPALKILLMAIAVIDDLGAIIIIALFYTADLSTTALACAGFLTAALMLLNRCGVRRPAAYILTGLLLWMAVLESGVHATLAGVVTALFMPRDHIASMEHALHPWVSFLIMPLFAFANAGVSLLGVTPDLLLSPLPLGIAAGLLIGKQAGIGLAVLAAVKFGWCAMPKGITARHIYGMSLLCGIGFTMSLFIGSLAFSDIAQMRDVRVGVLVGSLLSSVAGYMVLRGIKSK